jgi:hypothetical protein
MLAAASGAVCVLVQALKRLGMSTDGKVNELAARVVALLPAAA